MITKNKLFVLVICILSFSVLSAPLVPVTGNNEALESQDFNVAESFLLTLEDFISSVKNGNGNQVVGIYSPGKLAQSVEVQPISNLAYVSSKSDVLTQFRTAAKYSSLGFIAHNYLAGDLFFSLNNGDTAIVIYGDGHTQSYRIYDIHHYQALSPNDPYSNFKDLDNANTKILTAEQLFFKTYGLEGRLVFQTCIEEEGNSTWGRLFVLAIPISKIISSRQMNGRLGSH